MSTSTPRKSVKDVAHAVPLLGKKPRRSDDDRVVTTRGTTETMKASRPWATAPVLQAAVTIWNDDANAIEENRTLITSYREKLRAAEAKQRVYRRKWAGSTKQVIGAAQVVCDGSPEIVKELGLEVRTHAPRGALPVVEGLVTSTGPNPGEATVKWTRGRARIGFLVQTATDVATPSTYGAPVPVSKAKLTLTGGVSHAMVHFRVAAIDPSVPAGQTPWSAWAPAQVR